MTIRLITRMAVAVYAKAEKLKLKHKVSVTELREVLEAYEDVRDEDHVSVLMEWKKMCKAADAENLRNVVEVLERAMKRRCEDPRPERGGPSLPETGRQDIYPRTVKRKAKHRSRKRI